MEGEKNDGNCPPECCPDMKTKAWFLKTGSCLPLVFILLLNVACSPRAGKQPLETGAENSWQADARLAWPALALVQTGSIPLWFELGEQGPLLIESPGTASLNPYTPWPHARFIIGMQFWNGFLVLPVNRDGFIVLGRGRNPEEKVLYRISGAPLWDPYTAESFFLWKDKPAVLLYRNDFFAEPRALPIRPQVFTLDFHSPVPLGVSVPALESAAESGASEWEAEILRRGPGGFWYYRLKEKGKVKADVAYFRSADLEVEGARISTGEWRESSRPEKPENIPGYLAMVLGKLSEFGFKNAGAVKVISSDFEEERVFALSAAASYGPIPIEEGVSPSQLSLYGFCESGEALALVISQSGQGLYSNGQGVFSFSLPSLPEGFVYTGVAVLGAVLAASWEEQQEAGIGAAGFMIMAAGILVK